jgi:hypothetical protein
MLRTGDARTAAAYVRLWQQVDLHPLLATVQVPVLVLDRGGDGEEAAYVASLLPHGRFVNLAGEDFIPYYDFAPLVAAIREFVDETSESHPRDGAA